MVLNQKGSFELNHFKQEESVLLDLKVKSIFIQVLISKTNN